LSLAAARERRLVQGERSDARELPSGANGRAYLNFAGLGEEGEELVGASHGAANYERLVALRTSYHPTNLFRLNRNITPTRPLRRAG
jgi:Berberine and berberine like